MSVMKWIVFNNYSCCFQSRHSFVTMVLIIPMWNREVTRKYLDIPFHPLYNQECCLEVIDMKWSINQLQRYRQGDMPFDETVNLDSVKKRNPEIRDIAPIHVTGSCTIGATRNRLPIPARRNDDFTLCPNVGRRNLSIYN